jgi:hypothetical protein
MFQMKRILLVIALVATAMGSAFAQIKLGDNPGNLNQNALLELESSSKGLLLPRMTTAQAATMTSPPDGMMIYNTDSACICIRGAGFWHSLCAEGNGKPWGTLGNSNTDPVNNFVGTKDAQSLVFRTNNAEVMRILTNGNIGVGTTTPTNKLHIVAATNPLRLEGLQAGAATDEVVTVDATGVARILPMTTIGANSFTANNGLTKTGSNVQLGGALTAATAINTTATNTLAFGNLQEGTLATDSVLTTTAGGVIQRMSMAAIGANTITVGNGLTKVGNLITFGGALTAPTTVATTLANTLNITGLQTSAVTDSIVTIDAATGQLRRTTMEIIGANSIVVGNGLTKVGNLITFGGALTSPTSINTTATNTLTLGNLQTGTLNPLQDSILITGAGGVVSRVNINALSAASPDFWLDGAGLKPDGTTDNTDRVYRMGLVGIGLTTTPTSTFQVEGSMSASIVTTSAATFTVTDAHHTIIADCTAGVALTLPAAVPANRGRIYYISKSDETTNLLSFNIPLKLTESTNVSSYNYTKRLTIQSDGAFWRVISE